jgi:hypothetical protein
MEQITTDATGGKKADGDKVRFELLIPEFMEAFARVMTYGAKKYGDWNYLLLQRERVIGAVYRHINAYQRGERNDPETGESHLIHATCCMMMLWGVDNEFYGKAEKQGLGIHMHERPKSDSSAGVTQNRWADLQIEPKELAIPSKDDPIVQEFLKSLSRDERVEFSNDYVIYQSQLKHAQQGEAQMSDALISYFKRLEQFKKDKAGASADINTENVKVKGDLVAIRYEVHDFESNLSDFETHCSLNCQDYDDDALLVNRAEFVENGEWLVFHKNTIQLAMFKIITHDEFNSKLKHLFE